MQPRRRILISTYGSAGDLFPLIPLALRLRNEGNDVRCAVPRSLGLYLRVMGVAAFGLGDGSEIRVVGDREMFTTRFDGWASWRRTLAKYVGPSLAADVASLDSMFDTWRPDVVVASGFAAASRIAAHRAEVPLINASIYPQHRVFSGARAGFARDFTRVAHSIYDGEGEVAQPSSRELWGAPADLLLHDPALLNDEEGSAGAIGFPYWDEVVVSDVDRRLVDDRLNRPGPHVVVTLGSFVGLASRAAWIAAADAVGRLGVSAVFVGARGRWVSEAFADRPDILCVGFVPLAPIFARATATIHHGGIGTMFGALGAGCPAVVLAQAFDQSHNARMVEQAGIGLDGRGRDLGDALATVLDVPQFRQRAQYVARQLVPTREAVDIMTAFVYARARRSDR